MKKPKISIITITYNSEQTLERTIKSIINQQYDNLEYIVIDGGSTDKTIDIVNRYKKNISYFISEPDNGISDAFNKGIKVATGEIIGIINSDDGLLENALNNLVKHYDEEIGVYRGNVMLWNEETGYKCIEIPSMHFPKCYMNINVSHQSTFIRKDVYNSLGLFDCNCKYIMDFDLLMRLYNNDIKFKWINDTLAFYSLNGLTSTAYTKQRYQELRYVLKKNEANIIQREIVILIKWIKVNIKKIINKDIILKLKNEKHIEY